MEQPAVSLSLLDPPLSPYGVTRAPRFCSEACAGFKRLPRQGWPDYGLCYNPLSPRHGEPVLFGRECPYAILLPSLRKT